MKVYLNKVIKDNTKRYTTFHSLRHSFATYRLKDILDDNITVQTYNFIELSMQMGHQTPEMTINKYVHNDLLELVK